MSGCGHEEAARGGAVGGMPRAQDTARHAVPALRRTGRAVHPHRRSAGLAQATPGQPARQVSGDGTTTATLVEQAQARELAVVVDGPHAGRWYWRDELETMALKRPADGLPASAPGRDVHPLPAHRPEQKAIR